MFESVVKNFRLSQPFAIILLLTKKYEITIPVVTKNTIALQISEQIVFVFFDTSSHPSEKGRASTPPIVYLIAFAVLQRGKLVGDLAGVVEISFAVILRGVLLAAKAPSVQRRGKVHFGFFRS